MQCIILCFRTIHSVGFEAWSIIHRTCNGCKTGAVFERGIGRCTGSKYLNFFQLSLKPEGEGHHLRHRSRYLFSCKHDEGPGPGLKNKGNHVNWARCHTGSDIHFHNKSACDWVYWRTINTSNAVEPSVPYQKEPSKAQTLRNIIWRPCRTMLHSSTEQWPFHKWALRSSFTVNCVENCSEVSGWVY